MNFPAIIKSASKNLIKVADKNAPVLLTIAGTAILVGAVFEMHSATKKSEKKISEKKEELSKEVELDDGRTEIVCKELSKKEILQLTWKDYIPTVGMVILGIGGITGGQIVGHKRYTALLASYAALDKAYKTFQDETKAQIGNGKFDKIKNAITGKEIKENPPIDEEHVFTTGHGDTLMRDSLTGRYFRSDMDYIRRKLNEINKRLMVENWISLNEVYMEIGLEPVELGHNLGWEISSMDFIRENFSSFITELDGKEVQVVDLQWQVGPRYDYRDL